jgi:hypothetical protein
MQYDFNLAPNTGQQIDVAGKFFKYKSGNGVIRVRTSKGGVVDLLPGQGVWNTEFTSLTITDKSGLQNAGVILAGAFDFHDDRISGTVEVISAEKNRVMAGNCYSGAIGCAPTPGVQSMVQLWNPIGSGVNVFLNRIILGGTAAGEWYVRTTNTPLANVNAGSFENKKAGSLPSKAERRFEARTTLGGTIFDVFLDLNKPFDMVITEPLMVPPGRGVLVYPDAANVLSLGNFQFYEEPA